MESYIKKIILLVCLLSFLPNVTHSKITDQSDVAIKLDKKLCVGSKGEFLPLPNIKNHAKSILYWSTIITDRIAKKYGDTCKLNGLAIKGKINKRTYLKLQLGLKVLKAKRNKSTVSGNILWLDSQGGLITSAINIGNMIAEEGMRAIVPLNSHCYSSCVLIYAAAKTRSSVGDIGVHRPFANEISASSLKYPEYLKKYDALTPVLKRYFSKYGVSPALVDAMNVIPSDDIKILTEEELITYGLGFSNVAAKEHDKAKTIQICGQGYYDKHLLFHAFIKSCEKKFGISVLDLDERCWALAKQTYPNYMDESEACKTKKSNSHSHNQ